MFTNQYQNRSLFAKPPQSDTALSNGQYDTADVPTGYAERADSLLVQTLVMRCYNMPVTVYSGVETDSKLFVSINYQPILN